MVVCACVSKRAVEGGGEREDICLRIKPGGGGAFCGGMAQRTQPSTRLRVNEYRGQREKGREAEGRETIQDQPLYSPCFTSNGGG